MDIPKTEKSIEQEKPFGTPKTLTIYATKHLKIKYSGLKAGVFAPSGHALRALSKSAQRRITNSSASKGRSMCRFCNHKTVKLGLVMRTAEVKKRWEMNKSAVKPASFLEKADL
ncbi:MAG: hypothetical protein JW724_00230 [Candidatus Altiarchaeota archaeon]|nr:hypothetical protein [Candidatus Altiarchaeota archaeon]